MGGHLSVTYFPFLNMDGAKEIDFGFLKIWNFSAMKDTYVPDQATREHLEKIFAMHQSYGKPIEGIGVVSIGATDFRAFTEDEYRKIRAARLILFLSFIDRNNTGHDPNAGHSMVTSDTFDLYTQGFIVGDDHLSDRAGEIISFLRGGFELGRTVFERPGFVPAHFMFALSSDLFSSLRDMQAKRPRVFEKVITATELFFESYYNGPQLSKNARVLLQASAFEVLLDLPERDQRKHFKEAIGTLTNLPGEKTYTHFSERTGRLKVREKITIKQIWADLFYTLRNHIIHGNTPKSSDFVFKGARHTDITVQFFVLCVRKLIEKKLPGHPCDHLIEWGSWEDASQTPPTRVNGFVYRVEIMKKIARALKKKSP
ncbi:MAG TPA: hypothetical protein VMR46_00540 [Candidatus Paceibacterota bacterium]|nr:hypothetical protein [Candidatus Paceibacterota bacterium]